MPAKQHMFACEVSTNLQISYYLDKKKIKPNFYYTFYIRNRLNNNYKKHNNNDTLRITKIRNNIFQTLNVNIIYITIFVAKQKNLIFFFVYMQLINKF